MSKRIASSVLVVGILVLIAANVANAASYTGLGIEGRLMLPGGINPVVSATTEFKLQVRSPGAENCLLWEETQIKDLSVSSGHFAVSLNDNPSNRTDGGSYGIEKAFANSGSLNLGGGRCSVGTVYTPGPLDQRILVIMFRETAMSTWETFGPQQLDHAPMAIEAKQVGGFNSGSLLRVVEADGITPRIASLSPLSNAQYVELMAVISGSTSQYERAGKINGGLAPTMIPGQVLGWTGSAWTSFDPLAAVSSFAKNALPTCSAGQFLSGSSGVMSCASPASGLGTVTQVNTGTGLTGGGFTSSGTISIAAGGVGPTELAANAVGLGQINASAYSVTNAPNKLVARDASGNFAAFLGTLDGLKLNNSGMAITILSPLGASYTLTLPTSTGSSGQVLSTNGSGVTSWITVPTSGVCSLGSLTLNSSVQYSACIGVPAGAAVSCSPSVAQNVGAVWSAMSTTAGSVGLGGNSPGNLATWRCMWMN